MQGAIQFKFDDKWVCLSHETSESVVKQRLFALIHLGTFKKSHTRVVGYEGDCPSCNGEKQCW